MIDLKITTALNLEKIQEAADRAAKGAFARAAFKIRKTAMESIRPSPTASEPGQPPRTRRGQLRRAILYHADVTGAVIGPRESIVGSAGEAHEFGGEHRGAQFPERPFMAPALEEHVEDFAGEFSGSIGGS
jgi:phage gpG-like protein